MFTDEDVEVVAGRMRAWGKVLRDLGDPKRCRPLLDALDAGDGGAFHDIVDRWGLPDVTCIEIAETVTRLVHTGDYQPTRVCTILDRIRPLRPSPLKGRGYRLPDGTTLWLSEADWWQLLDHAMADEAWRDANADLLEAVGIMTCHIELVPSVARYDVTKHYQICPPTGDPHAVTA